MEMLPRCGTHGGCKQTWGHPKTPRPKPPAQNSRPKAPDPKLPAQSSRPKTHGQKLPGQSFRPKAPDQKLPTQIARRKQSVPKLRTRTFRPDPPDHCNALKVPNNKPPTNRANSLVPGTTSRVHVGPRNASPLQLATRARACPQIDSYTPSRWVRLLLFPHILNFMFAPCARPQESFRQRVAGSTGWPTAASIEMGMI